MQLLVSIKSEGEQAEKKEQAIHYLHPHKKINKHTKNRFYFVLPGHSQTAKFRSPSFDPL